MTNIQTAAGWCEYTERIEEIRRRIKASEDNFITLTAVDRKGDGLDYHSEFINYNQIIKMNYADR